MLLHQKADNVKSGSLGKSVMFPVVRFDKNALGFYEAITRILRIVANFIDQGVETLHGGVVLVSTADREKGFSRFETLCLRKGGSFHCFHLPASYSGCASMWRTNKAFSGLFFTLTARLVPWQHTLLKPSDLPGQPMVAWQAHVPFHPELLVERQIG
jgi:hypothetical protein